MTDHFAVDDMHAVHLAKNIVGNLNYRKQVDACIEPSEVSLLCIYLFSFFLFALSIGDTSKFNYFFCTTHRLFL